VASYRFTAPDGNPSLRAALVWNIRIDSTGGRWAGLAALYDLDLALYDTSLPDPVAVSAGRIDNTENIWTELSPGHDYELRVVAADAQPDFKWDYGLAWCVSP